MKLNEITAQDLIFYDFMKKISISKNSKFGIDLGGSKYDVDLFPPTILIITVGPRKFKISNPKFIVVQRGPEADIITESTVLL